MPRTDGRRSIADRFQRLSTAGYVACGLRPLTRRPDLSMATVQAASSPVPRPYVAPAPAPANDVRPDDQASPAFTVPDAPPPDTAKPVADGKTAKPDANTAASAGADRGPANAKPSGTKTATSSRTQASGRSAASDDTDQADAPAKDAVPPTSALALSLLAGGTDAVVSGDLKVGAGDKDETKAKTSDPEGKVAAPDTIAALVSPITVATVPGQVAPVVAPASTEQPQQPSGAAATPDLAIGKPGALVAPAPVAAATQALATADTDLAAAAEALVAALPAEAGAGSGSAKPAAPQGKAALTAARNAAAASTTQDGAATAAPDAAPAATLAKAVAGEASAGRTEATRHAGLTLQEGDAGRSAPPASAEAGAASVEPALLAPTDSASSPSFGPLVSAPTQGAQAGGSQAASATAGQPGTAATTVVSGVAIGNVPVEIGMRSLSGSSHFEIRLDPVELGRIDVKLEIDAAGSVRAHLLVDRPETLAFLQRDSSHLQRAFEQAGLSATSDGVALSLRQGSTDTGGGSSGRGGTPDDGASARAQAASRSADADTLDTASASLATRRYLWSRPSGVDVRI